MQKSCTFHNKKCSFHGGDREIWTLAPISRPTPFPGEPLRPAWVLLQERRGWDSNPRALADKRFSRPPRYDHFDTSPQTCFSIIPKSFLFVKRFFQFLSFFLSKLFFSPSVTCDFKSLPLVSHSVKPVSVFYHDKRMNVFLNHTHLSSKIIKT